MPKAPNYSVDQVELLQTVYDPTATESERDAMVVELVKLTGKKKGSIVAKLSNMKRYVSKTKAVSAVTGMEAQKKDALANRVRDLVEANFDRPEGVPAINPETLAKSNKTDLATLIRVLEFAFPTEEVEPSAEIVADENAS